MINTVFESRAAPSEGPALRVTVAVSLYNYQRYIERCVESVALQTCKGVELIVVDDCSTDNSAQVATRKARELMDYFAAVRIVSHVRNSGLAQARNTGFQLASADLVFVLDADNEIYPRAIERLSECLSTTNAGAAYSQLELFDEEVGVGQAGVWDPERFASGNYVDAMSLIRKSVWERVGGYSKMEVAGWEDYDFWCKLVEADIEGVFVPEMLCRYRVHGISMLRTESNPQFEKLHAEMRKRHSWVKLSG